MYGVDVQVKEVSCRKAGAGGWGNGGKMGPDVFGERIGQRGKWQKGGAGVARKDARYRLLQTESVVMKAETAQAGD